MPAWRLCRCIRLLNLLESQASYGAAELARELGVSKRTVYRDLGALAEAGVSLRFESKRAGYVVESPSRSTLSLSEDELTTLLLAAQSSLGSDPGFGDLVRQASTKLLARAESSLREKAARALKSLVVDSPLKLRLDGAESIWREVTQSISRRQRVRLSYRVPGDPVRLSSETVIPFQLGVSREGWYILARGEGNARIRRFDLGCIRGIQSIADETLCVRHRNDTGVGSPPASVRSRRGRCAGKADPAILADERP
jgi:predicted DNA-binding transcriptional regulator YafY